MYYEVDTANVQNSSMCISRIAIRGVGLNQDLTQKLNKLLVDKFGLIDSVNNGESFHATVGQGNTIHDHNCAESIAEVLKKELPLINIKTAYIEIISY